MTLLCDSQHYVPHEGHLLFYERVATSFLLSKRLYITEGGKESQSEVASASSLRFNS
jgi:hypothetical protein